MTTKVFNGGAGAVPKLHKNKEVNGKNKTTATKEKDEQEQQHQLPYLDEGIVTKILTKVDSAESLYNSLRYVCKSWYNIIFHNPDIHLNSLLPSKPPCLIIQNKNKSSFTYLKTKTEEERDAIAYNMSYTTCSVKLEEMEGFDDLTPIFEKLFIRACCNRLMLATPSGIKNSETLCVVDPLTNQRVVLPPRPINSNIIPVPVGFTFLPCTGKYKVVTAGHYRRRDQTPHNFIQVLTLSSSSSDCCGSSSSSSSNNDDSSSRLWRLIEAPQSIYSKPLAINGVLYWFFDNNMEGYLVSFDAAAEVFYTTSNSLFFYKDYRGFIEIGGYLAFWYCLPNEEELTESTEEVTFHVYVIEDLHKPGAEWKVLHDGLGMDIDFINKTHPSRPVLSVGNGEVMIFFNSRQGILWAYNLKSQRWWRVGHCLEEWDQLTFYGFNVNNKTPVPFDSLFSTV